jgi:hypothetical protein
MEHTDVRKQTHPSRKPRPDTLTFLGPAPLLEGEDEAAYNDLLARASAAVKPKDMLEEIWLREIVDHSWESLRFRRLKTELMHVCKKDGLMAVLQPIIGLGEAFRMASVWAQREEEDIDEKIELLLTSVGFSMDSVWARVLERNLDKIERIDRMETIVATRRNAALREIERHRASLAKQLRAATDEIQDAEYQEIPDASEAA